MWGRWLALGVMVMVVLTVEVVLIRSALSAFRADLRQRPNCSLVDDAVREHRVPDAKVQASCRSSARGLIYSLTPADLAAMRRGR